MSFVIYCAALSSIIATAAWTLNQLGVPTLHIVNAAVILLAFGMLIGASRTQDRNSVR